MSPEPLLEGGIVVGNVFDKHHSRNPFVRRLMAGFEQGLDELLGRCGTPRSVLEMGCGEGHVTSRLASRFHGTRLDILDVRTPTPWTQVLGRPRPAARP